MTTTAGSAVPVARLVRPGGVVVGVDEPIERVYGRMIEHGVRFAAVRQDGRITAVLDREQLRLRLAAATGQLCVRDVMCPGMACLLGDATAEAAERLMRVTGSAAVPVLDGEHRFVGLVTAEDLADVRA